MQEGVDNSTASFCIIIRTGREIICVRAMRTAYFFSHPPAVNTICFCRIRKFPRASSPRLAVIWFNITIAGIDAAGNRRHLRKSIGNYVRTTKTSVSTAVSAIPSLAGRNQNNQIAVNIRILALVYILSNAKHNNP